MRIIAGQWRGRSLAAPAGLATRPTSERMRQAIFDMILHAPWGGRGVIEGAHVLDVFAGTGAFGLEALSRGAGRAIFLERDRAAVAVLHANIDACRAGGAARVVACDATRPPQGERCGLVFLDPPYHEMLVPKALAALEETRWIGPEALIVAETARDEPPPPVDAPLAQRDHGAARVTIWRTAATFKPGVTDGGRVHGASVP